MNFYDERCPILRRPTCPADCLGCNISGHIRKPLFSRPRGSLVRLDGELPVLSLVAVGSHAVDGLAKLDADKDGRLLPVCDFPAFPLCLGGLEGVKHPARGRRRVDRVLQGNQVSMVIAEILGEVQKFLGVARQLGDDAGDAMLRLKASIY